MDVVILVCQLVGCLSKTGSKLILQHLEFCIDALACASQYEIACCIEVLQQFSKSCKITECSVMYSLQVAEPSLQTVLWVGFHTV